MTERIRLVVEIDLAPTSEWGDTPEGSRTLILSYLTEILHLCPVVTIDAMSTVAELVAAKAELTDLKAELAGPCAHTATALIYREERDELRSALAVTGADFIAATRERDEAKAAVGRVTALIDVLQDVDHWVAISKVRAALDPTETKS